MSQWLSKHDERAAAPRDRLRPPVRAWNLAEWALVPLRIFIGATFTFAGMQKLANPNFFRRTSPISIQSQLIAAAHTSPLRGLLVHLDPIAKQIGLSIAFGEIAVGLALLIGLWTRLAAVSGLLISLMLFLTVSFHAAPYYTGSDIVFLFAWTPFLVAGAGTTISLDAWIARRSARREGLPDPSMVPIAFSTVQSLCGNYDGGACRARGGEACDASACPVLIGARTPAVERRAVDAFDRRSLVIGSAAAAALGGAALLVGGAAADTGKMINNAPTPTTDVQSLLPIATTTTTPPASKGGATTTTVPVPRGRLLGPASEVHKNSAAAFTIPVSNDPGIVIHETTGTFVAYNAVCPHMGCTVGYSSSSRIIICPCHGSEFEVSNGRVIVGPAPHGLTKLKIVEGANGNLYLQ